MQGNAEIHFNLILYDVQLKINQVNCFFPLITYFSCESLWLVSARAWSAVAGRPTNNYRTCQHTSYWISPRERLWNWCDGGSGQAEEAGVLAAAF